MTIRLAVLGCGAVARRYHLPALKKCADVEIVAFASRSVESAKAAAAEWGGGDVSADWRTVVRRDDVDAVDVCSPNVFHREQTVTAARAGKHVLVEKPMACTVGATDEMIRAATDSGVVLQVAHNLRYLPAIAGARSAVEKVGRINGIRAAFGHSGPRDWSPDSTWFFDSKLAGGGALLDLGIHAIDLLRFVTGLEVTEVAAMLVGTGAVEDAAQLVMRFDNGAAGTLHASWVARPAPDFALTIFGLEGTLHLDARSPLTLRKASGDSEEIATPAVPSSPYEDFVRAIRGEGPAGAIVPASAADGRAAVAVADAAYASAWTGTTIEVAR